MNKFYLLQPIEGSPLYKDGKLMGIYTSMQPRSDQISVHPKGYVYKFIILEVPAGSSNEDKKKKVKTSSNKNTQSGINGIWDFGNVYNNYNK